MEPTRCAGRASRAWLHLQRWQNLRRAAVGHLRLPHADRGNGPRLDVITFTMSACSRAHRECGIFGYACSSQTTRRSHRLLCGGCSPACCEVSLSSPLVVELRSNALPCPVRLWSSAASSWTGSQRHVGSSATAAGLLASACALLNFTRNAYTQSCYTIIDTSMPESGS